MEIRDIALPLPTQKGAKVTPEVSADGTIDVSVPKTLTTAEARKAITLELSTFRYLVGASSEVAEGLADGYGQKVISHATNAAKQVRALYSNDRSILDEDGKVNTENLKERMARAKARAVELGRDADSAMSTAYRSGLRQAAQIERSAVVYAAAKAQAVVLHAAVEAIKNARSARKHARSAQRALTDAEQRKADKKGVAKNIKEVMIDVAPKLEEESDDLESLDYEHA